MASCSIIAAFDFDHTLTDRDSLLPFLSRLKGSANSSGQLALLGPAFIRYLMGSISRQEIKEKILERFIKGMAWSDLEAMSEHYAFHQLDHFIKPAPLHRLAWHQAQGHCCILISASLEIYLKPWAALHGFDAVLASRLERDSIDRFTGRLAGLNCWGPEKVRRLIEHVGPKHNYQLYAYGDSKGDRELLDFADFPFYRKFS